MQVLKFLRAKGEDDQPYSTTFELAPNMLAKAKLHKVTISYY